MISGITDDGVLQSLRSCCG